MITEELICLLILHHIKGLGSKSIRKLLQSQGTAAEVVKLFGKEKIGSEWKEDLKAVENEKVTLISFQDPNYPQSLLLLEDPPLLLYVKGVIKKEDESAVAIVGTRNASLYGKEYASKFGSGLAGSGVTVVSGLARGIDSAAHKGALQQGRTFAVLGSGIGNIYPQENLKLAEEISNKGALISEYPMQQAAATYTFPRRNRLIAALTKALLLIESPLVGGSMITANIASQLKKPLFALPARIDMPSFAGNHDLIKKGQAMLMESCQDLLLKLQIPYNQPKQNNIPLLSDEEQAFFFSLPNEEKSIEELVLLTQLPIMKLNVLLNRLVVKKLLRNTPARFTRKSKGFHGKIINYC